MVPWYQSVCVIPCHAWGTAPPMHVKSDPPCNLLSRSPKGSKKDPPPPCTKTVCTHGTRVRETLSKAIHGAQGPRAPGAPEWVQGSLGPWGPGAPGALGPWAPWIALLKVSWTRVPCVHTVDVHGGGGSFSMDPMVWAS